VLGGPVGFHRTVEGSNAGGPATDELCGSDSPASRQRYPSKPPEAVGFSRKEPEAAEVPAFAAATTG
jgi:hypothetical protein